MSQSRINWRTTPQIKEDGYIKKDQTRICKTKTKPFVNKAEATVVTTWHATKKGQKIVQSTTNYWDGESNEGKPSITTSSPSTSSLVGILILNLGSKRHKNPSLFSQGKLRSSSTSNSSMSLALKSLSDLWTKSSRRRSSICIRAATNLTFTMFLASRSNPYWDYLRSASGFTTNSTRRASISAMFINLMQQLLTYSSNALEHMNLKKKLWNKVPC